MIEQAQHAGRSGIMRILLVDDDELLTQALTSFLTSQHYAVDVATDGEAGWDYTQAATYDLIVLDINLPKLDGVRLCQKLRRNKCNSPILLLTAKGDSSDKVMGLDAGADDYLVKPCTTDELSARIRALLRRQSPSATPLLEWGSLCLDPGICEVTYQGQALTLSPKEYSLLELFLRTPQRVFSGSMILEHLWGFENAPGEETIRTHIKRLRQKLKAVGAENVIDTVYGMGYRLAPLVETAVSTATATSVADEARAAAIALWDQFKPPILERMTSLDEAIAALKTGTLSKAQRQAAAGDAHKLAGSLGMFGFPEGSRLGQAIEHWFETATGTQDIEQLQALVTALHQELEHPPQPSKNDLLTALCEDSVESTLSSKPLPQSLSPGKGEEEHKQSRTPEIKVLIVDDDVLILKSLQQILPLWGLCPITLNNALKLWDTLESEKPDLLILDVDMPHVNGIEVCQVIRNNNTWSGLPILFLTAHRDPEMVLQLYTAGADDYVAKPFTEPEVITRIFNRLERNRRLRLWQRPIP
jgi:two-component system, OmpR family, response regulator